MSVSEWIEHVVDLHARLSMWFISGVGGNSVNLEMCFDVLI